MLDRLKHRVQERSQSIKRSGSSPGGVGKKPATINLFKTGKRRLRQDQATVTSGGDGRGGQLTHEDLQAAGVGCVIPYRVDPSFRLPPGQDGIDSQMARLYTIDKDDCGFRDGGSSAFDRRDRARDEEAERHKRIRRRMMTASEARRRASSLGKPTPLDSFLLRSVSSSSSKGGDEFCDDASAGSGFGSGGGEGEVGFHRARSESEVISELENCSFLTRDLDATRHMLENLPDENAEGAGAVVHDYSDYLMCEMSEKDVAQDFVMARLSRHVQARYDDFMGEMNRVQEIDTELAKANVMVTNARRKLHDGQRDVVNGNLDILHKRRRRENLHRIRQVVADIRRLLKSEADMGEAVARGDFPRALEICVDTRLALEEDRMMQLTILNSARARMAMALPGLRAHVDHALTELCSVFDPVAYDSVLRAFLILEEQAMERGDAEREREAEIANMMLLEAELAEGGASAERDALLDEVAKRSGISGLADRIQRQFVREADESAREVLLEAVLSATIAKEEEGGEGGAAGGDDSGAAGGAAQPVGGSAPPQQQGSPFAEDAAEEEGKKDDGGRPDELLADRVKASTRIRERIRGAVSSTSHVAHDAMSWMASASGKLSVQKRKSLEDVRSLPLSDLWPLVPPEAVLSCCLRLYQRLTSLLHNHYLFTQWHRAPFSNDNESDEFLHRCRIDDDEQDDDFDESGDEEDESDESDEDDEDDEDGGGTGSEDAYARALRQTQALAERRERLERAQLSVVRRGLRDGRQSLWEHCQAHAVRLLSEVDLDGSTVQVNTFVAIIAATSAFVELGEEFSGSERAVHALRGCVRGKSKQFFDGVHRDAFDTLRQMMESEVWYRVPFPTDTAASPSADSPSDQESILNVVQQHVRGVVWPRTHVVQPPPPPQVAAADGDGDGAQRDFPFAASLRRVCSCGGAGGQRHASQNGAATASTWEDFDNLRQQQDDSAKRGQRGRDGGENAAPALLPTLVDGHNPFALVSGAADDGASSLLELDVSDLVPSGAPTSAEEEGAESKAGGDDASDIFASLRAAELSNYNSRAVLTQTALNGFARQAGRYLQLMTVVQPVAAEAFVGLTQLFDFYLFVVFSLFVPSEAKAAMFNCAECGGPAPSADEEASARLLQCDHGSVDQLRQHIRAIHNDLNGGTRARGVSNFGSLVESMSLVSALGFGNSGGAGLPSKDRLVSNDEGATAANDVFLCEHRCGFQGSFAAVDAHEATCSRRHDGGAGGDVGAAVKSEGGASSSSGDKGARAGSAVAAIAPKVASDGALTPDSPGSPLAFHRARLMRALSREESAVTDALQDEGTTYGMLQRCVAAESCGFLVAVMRAVHPQLAKLVPQSQRSRMDAFYGRMGAVVKQLQAYVYHSVAPLAVSASCGGDAGIEGIALAINQVNWDTDTLHEDANVYVGTMVHQLRSLWENVRTLGDGVLPPGAVPVAVRDTLWTECVQAVMGALVEGFSRVKKCSTEGRALMSMDLQALQIGLDEVRRARPSRGKVYVDNFIKAFYYGEEDCMKWIGQNWETYHLRHVLQLLVVGVGTKMRKKKGKELARQIESLYTDPHDQALAKSDGV